MNSRNDKFLGKLYDILVREDILNIVQDEKEVHLSTKIERLNKYLDKLKRVQYMMLEKDRLDVLRKMYYDRYIIKEEEISESYFKSIEMRYLNEGHGYVNLVSPVTDADKLLRKQHVSLLISEQKSSLDSWLNYLLSSDSDYLDMWAKVWTFQGMLKIGNFDANKNSYGRRSKVTVNPFVPFDAEIMGRCVELVKDSLDDRKPTEIELDKLVDSGNFAKLYGMMLANKKEIKIAGSEGIWVKYVYETEEDVLIKEQTGVTPEYIKLYDSLQGYNTGWCTAASRETAKSQICGSSNYKGGDFYVYYSIDENGEYKIPRIAIRMEGDTIGEIRGIADEQNIEPVMNKVLEDKLREFPDAIKYEKKVIDMKRLTAIYNKYLNKEILSMDDLWFLYEIESNIEGFGFKKDPRIDKVLRFRNAYDDLSLILGCKKSRIDFDGFDYKNNLKYYNGDLYLDYETDPKKLKLPEYLKGNLKLDGLISAVGLKLPKVINGNLSLNNLRSAVGLKLPEVINGNLILFNLSNIEKLKFPSSIGGDLGLGITSAKNVHLPKVVGGSLYLSRLTSTDGLVLPSSIGGDLGLSGLQTADNLTLPKTINGNLDLGGLITAEGLVLPETIRGDLYLESLTSLKKIVLPRNMDDGMISIYGECYTLETVIEMQKQEELGFVSNISGICKK